MTPGWLKCSLFFSNVTQYLDHIINVYTGSAKVLSIVPLIFYCEMLIINKIITVERPK